MKNKKIIIFMFLVLVFILFFSTKSQASLNLNELDFDVKINADGSMDVKETWDIYISDTNTLFKTFKRDNSKYSSITNVKVKDVTNGNDFSQIFQEMYHVTKNCYFGLVNSKGMYEIAWGVGFDNDSGTRTYEISYTVNDAIAQYNDYSELYWQFIGDEFEIPAKKVKGKIIFPMNAEKKEDIRVWGHTEDLNGEIYVTDLNKIEFSINKYRGNQYIEVRSLFPNNIVEATNRTYNYNILDSVLKEETEWANEANVRREKNKKVLDTYKSIAIVITCILGCLAIKKIINFNKLDKKIKPTMKLKYYRELPYEDATPAEALFMRYNGNPSAFSASFAANILDLALKKHVELNAESTGNGITKTDIVKIKFTNNSKETLKEDEQLTLDFLQEVAQGENEITTKDITKYLKKHTSKITKLDKELKEIIENFEVKREVFFKEKFDKSAKCVVFSILYFMAMFITIIFMGLMTETYEFSDIKIGLLIIAMLILNGIIFGFMAYKINIFSQEGVDEKEKWKAFIKYMEDFSLLKEKEVPSLIIWEKYLVFATAFGISEKVLKQLKVVYPEINDMNSSMYNTYSYINIMNTVNIGECINSSVYSAVGSSESGSGGGFSSGGGGGRRPVEAAADAKI